MQYFNEVFCQVNEAFLLVLIQMLCYYENGDLIMFCSPSSCSLLLEICLWHVLLLGTF